ncbi:MAG: polyprenyl synthetase family protein [Capsulimonadaceae bacterium]
MTVVTPDSPHTPESQFLTCVADDMAAVERILHEEIRSDVRAAYAISGHTLVAGGKRLRPALVVLSARAALASFPARTVHSSAAAAELIHMASLIHDDVVDLAEERRGRPTANAVFGNQISVLVGDYLLAKSIYLAAREGNLDVIRVFSHVTIGLSEGEVLQITAKGDSDTSEETYRGIIEKKTAGFIAGCCRIGAMLAEADPNMQEALAGYGMSCGLAFQIADDLLDYVGDPRETGKALDGDLREGKMTLPLILALRDCDPARRAELQAVLEDPEKLTDAGIALVHRTIEEHDGYARTAVEARGHARAAQSALESVPESCYRQALVDLADYAVNRRR